MFYSETLLAKTGPLARVWLAANLERKLTKQNVLSSNLENNVKDIIGRGQAPMALRLSGQLLLGVAKIYGRKVKYLVEDAREALTKIRIVSGTPEAHDKSGLEWLILEQAFRPGSGSTDLQPHQMHANNSSALILPDALTELDLFALVPDPRDLLRDNDDGRVPGKDATHLHDDTTQLLHDRRMPSYREQLMLEDDIAVDWDFGLEPGEQAVRSSPEPSVEMVRGPQTPRHEEPTLLDDLDLGLDFGDEGDMTNDYDASTCLARDNDMLIPDADDGSLIPAAMDDGIAAANEAASNSAEETAKLWQRDGESSLSSIRFSIEGDLEHTYHLDQDMEQTEDFAMVQAAQRTKRRKVLHPDPETQLHISQIKKQQEDRSTITKAPVFLSHDPVLLQWMEMQRNESFVCNLMGDGCMAGLARELRGILSLEVVRQAGEKKRKRDSGIADVMDEEGGKTLQMEVPEDDDFGVYAGAVDFVGNVWRSDGIQPPSSDLNTLHGGALQADIAGYQEPAFESKEALIHASSLAGPVSLGAKKAVHLLRLHFAPDYPPDVSEPPTLSKQTKGDVFFSNLCPEWRTSEQDATKIFFEMLVLGTKDAVEIKQESGELGLPIRVRGKRGLWVDGQC